VQVWGWIKWFSPHCSQGNWEERKSWFSNRKLGLFPEFGPDIGVLSFGTGIFDKEYHQVGWKMASFA
jgi:hypothetical protein